tara:strand:- start:3284 stop:3505 length:222 start_codon:yes stop_codon:yes gene_type:complete
MRLYKNHYYTDDGESQGYEFFTSKREAHKAFRYKDEGNEHEERQERAVSITFKPSLVGVVDLLNKVARHPDNG